MMIASNWSQFDKIADMYHLILHKMEQFCFYTVTAKVSKRALESEAGSPVPKKKLKYLAKFQPVWKGEFPWISSSKKGIHHVLCTVCHMDINIGHSGKTDLVNHASTEKHKLKLGSTVFNHKVTDMFKKKPDTDNVSRAEVLFADFVAEHNLPFSVADHFTDLCKRMFPDSQIAQKFSARRTKTTHIVNRVLGPEMDKLVTQKCRDNKFSVMVDKNNDQGDRKFMAILVRLFDEPLQCVTTRFLAMPVCNIGTADNLFSARNQVFIDRDIPWRNCIGYSSDNANVMVGHNNSLLSRIRDQNPTVISTGCVCHLANLCTVAAVKTLPVSVEEFITDIFFHFNKSSKRKEVYKNLLEFTETEPLKIVKHCSTRWLSLEKCVRRVLQQWPALCSYFESHSENEVPGRVQRVRDGLVDPEMWLFFSFLESVLPILNEFNTTFQAGAAMVGHLHCEMQRLLRRLLGKFVLTRVIAAAEDVTHVDYQAPDSQHPDDNIAIGLKTREYLKENGDVVPPETVTKFFRHVRLFYSTVVTSMLKKFPFEDSTLRTLAFLNPETREKTTIESVVQLSQRVEPDLNVTSLQDQTEEYMSTPISQLPPFQSTDESLEAFWVKMKAKTLPGGKQQFEILAKMALTCLTIPHSNADPERCFSVLKKIETDSRSRLSDDTIHNLMSVKFNNENDCVDFEPTRAMLSAAKSCCNE